MKNFIEETLSILKKNNKTKEDVLWCGSEEFGYFSVDDLFEISPKDYDSGYGGQKIAEDLLIVGKDFWLERYEYDGSEWWEFKQLPKKPEKYNKPNTVCNGDSRATLEEMNK